MPRTPFTERLARAGAARPKLTVAAWLVAFVAAGAAIAMLLGSALTSDDDFTNRPESKRAEQIVEAAFPLAERRGAFDADVAVVVHVPPGGDLPAAAGTVERRIRALPAAFLLDGVRQPYRGATADRSPVAPDGRTALIHFDLAPDADDLVEQLVDKVEALDRQGSFEVAATGEEVVDLDFERTAESDLVRGR